MVACPAIWAGWVVSPLLRAGLVATVMAELFKDVNTGSVSHE